MKVETQSLRDIQIRRGLLVLSRATEDTISSLLKEELEKLGVKVELIPSIDTPVGTRKPDLLCRNSGVYPVEAKFSERDLISAIAKVQNDYLKHYKVLGVKGGFAILYPGELSHSMQLEGRRDLALSLKFKLVAMFPPNDSRPFKVYECLLPEIAQMLAEHVLAHPKVVEPSIDYIIKSLRDSALYLLKGLQGISSTELVSFFGGKDVFRNILQYEEGKYPVEELRLAAAYLLVNQLLFYHALSRRKPEFEEIDPDELENPSALNRYFAHVLDINYRTVFSYDVASLIPPKFLAEVKTIVNVISGLDAQKVGADFLGTVFHDLIPFEIRKNVGAFYTNVLAAEMLAFLSIDHEDAKVADFAVGSGGLIVAAYRRKKSLVKGSFSQETHKRFLQEELLGIDVMPFAANVAACHLALQSPEFLTNKVCIAIWDSTDLKPGRAIPSVAGLKMVLTGQSSLESYISVDRETKGAVSLHEKVPEEISLQTYDVVIMNPPFTRQERMPKEYKEILLTRFNDYRDYLHGQLGYYSYFIMLADRFLKDGGTMALVLPATVLRVRSCEGLRRLWSEHYHVKYIITTSQRSAFSESVHFRELLLVASKVKLAGDERTVMAVLKEIPRTPSEAREIAELIKDSKKNWENEQLSVRVYNYARFRNSLGNWFRYVAVNNPSLVDMMDKISRSDKLILFGSRYEADEIDLRYLKFEDFHGFILNKETSAQKRIDSWVVDAVSRDSVVARHRVLGWKVKVPMKALGRGLRRLSYTDTIDVSSTSDYVVLSWFEGITDMARSALTDRELNAFRKEGVESWRDKFEGKASQVLFARRFDLSAPGTSLLSFYSDDPILGIDMWCIHEVDREWARVLALWFNSTLCLLQTLILRTETRGAWMKVHDYMLSEMLVPDRGRLSENEVKQLLNVFETVRGKNFKSIVSQLESEHPSRRLIDSTWLTILGFTDETDSFLDRLYDLTAKEIESLKRLMKEHESPV